MRGRFLTIRGMVMRKTKGILIGLVMMLTISMVACDGSEEVTSENSSQDIVAENQSESVSEDEGIDATEPSSDNDAQTDDTSESDVQENDASEVSSEANSESSEPEGSSEEVTSEDAGTSEEQVPSEPESAEPEFVVEDYDAVLFVKKAVNVRKGPSTDYERIGSLGKGEQIQVTGIADTGWYQIQYGEEVAYVSSSYLMDEASYQAMIAEEEALAAQAAAEQQAAQQQPAPEQQQPTPEQQQPTPEQQQPTPEQQQPAPEQQQPVPEQQPQVNTSDYKAQVVAIMNQERANAGVGGITQNASLDAVAQVRAQEIVQSFSHTRPDGSSCFTILDQNGIVYMTAGENIAAGYGTPAEVMAGWMNSEGHRANILNGSFGQVGIGYYTDPNTPYVTYWVQIFTN